MHGRVCFCTAFFNKLHTSAKVSCTMGGGGGGGGGGGDLEKDTKDSN